MPRSLNSVFCFGTDNGIVTTPVFKAEYHEDLDGWVVSNPERLRFIVPAELGISLEPGAVVPSSIFGRFAFRSGERGEPICSFRSLHADQYQMLSKFQMMMPDNDITAHFEDLADWRAKFEDVAAIEDDDLRFDVYAYDAHHMEGRDERVTQMEAVERHLEALSAVDDRDDVLDRIHREMGIDPDRWMDLSAIPTYLLEPLRAAVRKALDPIIGNVGTIEDMRVMIVPFDEQERLSAFRRWLKTSEETKILPVFRFKELPGYVTSPPSFGEKDGVAVMMYRDHMAWYVYSWQSNPDLDLRVKL